MNARRWLHRARALSRQDLMPPALAVVLVVVSASVLAAAVRERGPDAPELEESAWNASPEFASVLLEEEMATAERPPEIRALATGPVSAAADIVRGRLEAGVAHSARGTRPSWPRL